MAHPPKNNKKCGFGLFIFRPCSGPRPVVGRPVVPRAVLNERNKKNPVKIPYVPPCPVHCWPGACSRRQRAPPCVASVASFVLIMALAGRRAGRRGLRRTAKEPATAAFGVSTWEVSPKSRSRSGSGLGLRGMPTHGVWHAVHTAFQCQHISKKIKISRR